MFLDSSGYIQIVMVSAQMSTSLIRSTVMGKWSDLPLDLIECVDQHLDFLDKVRIRATCTLWNSFLGTLPKLVSDKLPWLLLHDTKTGSSLYSVHEANFYPLNIPEFKDKIFKGSSHGWIITMDDVNSTYIDDIYAVNPLTRAVLKLPPRSSFPDIYEFNPRRVGHEYILKHFTELDIKPERYRDEPEPEPELYPMQFSKGRINHNFTHKVVLSSSPTNDDCIAVAIYGECSWIIWCRPRHKRWTSFKKCNRKGRGVEDVIFHKGNLHVLYVCGVLEIFDSIDPKENVRLAVECFIQNPRMISPPVYLAACPNYGIIMASRVFKHDEIRDGVCDLTTHWILLFKLVEESKTWVEVDEVEGVGENIIFIGLNMSSLITVSDDFKSLGYKRNCIYYTDHFAFMFSRTEIQNDSDMGVYHIDEPYIEILPGFKVDEPEVFWPPPIWVTPSVF